MKAIKILLLIACSSFILSLSAQNIECIIQGPEYFPCPDVSGTYFVNCDSSYFEVQSWSVEPNIDASIIGYSRDSNSVEVQFLVSGLYIIEAIVLKADGSIDSLDFYVEISSEGASIEGCYETRNGCLTVCEGSEMSIYGIEEGSFYQIDGAESINFRPNGVDITWGSPGHGFIYFETSCPGLEQCVRILPKAIANFEFRADSLVDTLEVCINEPVHFVNLSEHGDGYTWHFGDGQTSQSLSPTHQYENSGLFRVLLRTNTVCDCDDEAIRYVRVTEGKAPSIDCISTICEETRQVYYTDASDCNQFQWQISDNGSLISGGGPNDNYIEVIWHEGPDGWIDLSVSDCSSGYCLSPSRFRVPIISDDGPLVGDEIVCSSELTRYEVPEFPGTEYNWTLSGGGTIIGDDNNHFVFVQWDDTQANVFTKIEVTYNNCHLGCGGSDHLSIKIRPELQIRADRQVCQYSDGTAEAFAGFNTTSPASADWELQDESGQVIRQFDNSSSFTTTFDFDPGNYYWVAKVISDQYCNEERRQLIKVLAKPSEPLEIKGLDKICPGKDYLYSIERSGTFETNWEFVSSNDTSYYNGNQALHAFNPIGPYQVLAYHVDLQDPTCISDPITKSISRVRLDSISGEESPCFESIESYEFNYVEGLDYEWQITPSDAGEILHSDLNRVKIFWKRSGSAQLLLSTCAVTTSKSITVGTPLAINIFGARQICMQNTAPYSSNYPHLRHEWRDDDGNLASNSDTAHLEPGYYELTVWDDNNCSHTEFLEIVGMALPQVHISSPKTADCYGSTSELVATGNSDIMSYEWIHDGMIVGTNPKLFATDSGSYYVVATNAMGCSTRSSDVHPFVGCRSQVGDTSVFDGESCYNLFHNFNISKSSTQCDSQDYSILDGNYLAGSARWSIRDVNGIILSAFRSDVLNHRYTRPGYYHIVVRARRDDVTYTSQYCDDFTRFVDIVPLVADFEANIVCEGEVTQFQDLSTLLPDYQATAWEWDFGDPASGTDNTSSDRNPTHIFSSAGLYNVKLAVQSSDGCWSELTKEVRVSGGVPLPIIAATETCESTGTLIYYDGDNYKNTWAVFYQGTRILEASSDSLIMNQSSVGNYRVELSSTDIYGCQTSNAHQIEVFPNTLSGDIDVRPQSTICEDEQAILSSPPGGTNWLWSTGETIPQIQSQVGGYYDLRITDQYGCQYEPEAAFIELLPVPSVMVRGRITNGNAPGPWLDSLEMCEGTPFEIRAFTSSNHLIQWNNSMTQPSLLFDEQNITLPAPGVQRYSVVASNPTTGCDSEPFEYQVVIHDAPEDPFILATDGQLCAYQENTLRDVTSQNDVYLVWSNGKEGPEMITDQAGDYSLTAYTEEGCSARSNSITIRESAPVHLFPQGCYEWCKPHEVCLPIVSQFSSYRLLHDGSEVDRGNSLPTSYEFSSSGNYQFEIRVNNGCTVLSPPLELDMQDGQGDIKIEVFSDVDQDGTVSPADTLVPNIDIRLDDPNVPWYRRAISDSNGSFTFRNIPQNQYIGHIDQGNLNPKWIIVIDSLNQEIINCDESHVIQFLITENCQVASSSDTIDICAGKSYEYSDSTWLSPGHYEYHHLSVAGCDSMVSVILREPDSLQIQIQVWDDVDRDNTISAADSLLPNIQLLGQSAAGSSHNLNTSRDGVIDTTILRNDYLIFVDPLSLSSNTKVIIDSLSFDRLRCENLTLDFLLQQDCPEVTISIDTSFCMGDTLVLYDQIITNFTDAELLLNRSQQACDTTLKIYAHQIISNFEISAEIQPACSNNEGGEVELSVESTDSIVNYSWTPSVSSTYWAGGLDTGYYTVTLTDAQGCQDSYEIHIEQALERSFNILDSFFTTPGIAIGLPITGDTDFVGVHYLWDPVVGLSCTDCSHPEANLQVSQRYGIQITDDQGCQFELFTDVIVSEDIDSTLVFVPNAFSPDQNNRNDRATLYSIDQKAFVEQLAIYSRWGNRVYLERNKDIQFLSGWDGTYRNQNLPSDVYVMHFRLRLSDGNIVEDVRDITLLR